ncbi:GIP, partial [Symbiodinium sp. KB8]
YRPMLIRLANRLVVATDAGHTYTAIRVSFQAASGWHRDLHNEKTSMNLVMKLSRFEGGRIVLNGGVVVEYDERGSLRFDLKENHSVEPSVGPRLVLIAYTPANAARLSVLDVNLLLSLGFNVPVNLRPAPHAQQPVMKAFAAQAVNAATLSPSALVAGSGCTCRLPGVESMSRLSVPLAAAVPGEFVTSESNRYRYFICCMSSVENQLILEGPNETLGGVLWLSGRLLADMAMCEDIKEDAELLRHIMEQLEEALTGVPNRSVRLQKIRRLAKAVDESLVGTYQALMRTQLEASAEVVGTGEQPLLGDHDPDVLLQTRQVSLAEARSNIDHWKQAIADELTALTVVHTAVRVVTKSELDRMADEGSVIQTIPGKLVLTEKAPDRRKRARLKQADADPSLWLVLEALEGKCGQIEFRDEQGEILAILGVYVDDLLFSGPRAEIASFLLALTHMWTTSDPSWIEDGLRFCGVEIDLAEDGSYMLHQSAYLRDLVSKYAMPDRCVLPDFKVGYAEPETVTIPNLRRAQKLVGELLWLTGRTRPDAAFHVNKLGQYCSKFPVAVYKDGLQVLGY